MGERTAKTIAGARSEAGARPAAHASAPGRCLGRLLGALVLASTALAAAGAQRAQPRVAAQLSAGVVRLGDQVTLVIQVTDAESVRLLGMPEVEGLAFGQVTGPATQRGTSWVNGRRSSWRTDRWSVRIRPTAAGDYEIPPIPLEVDGSRAETRSLDLRVVRDLSGENLGFLEVHAPERVVEGQPFSLELVFGWDRAGDLNYADLALPWWDELPGAVELDDPELPPGATRVDGVTVNNRLRVVVEELEPRERGGRELRTFRLVKRFLPGRPGELEFSASFLEFGRLARSRSFFSERSEKQKSYFVEAPGFAVDVVPLPAEGQPYDYSGAVGQLTARATADTRDVVVGDSIKLTVDWEGDGNLEFFHPPDLARLDAFGDFRVYGRTEEKGFSRRRVVYDLAPLSDAVDEIPSVPLSYFDPVEESYEVVETDPIPIRASPLEGAVSLGEEQKTFSDDIRDIDTRAPVPGTGAEARPAVGDGTVVLALFFVPSLWLLLRALVRRRRGDPDAPLARRRRKAERVLRRELASADDAREKLAAFHAFLAARTREPDEAWIGRSAADWADTLSGLTPADVQATDEILGRLEHAAYGAPVAPAEEPEPDAILAVAHRWTRGGRP